MIVLGLGEKRDLIRGHSEPKSLTEDKFDKLMDLLTLSTRQQLSKPQFIQILHGGNAKPQTLAIKRAKKSTCTLSNSNA